MATCVDVCGATYPAKVGGTAITPLEGKSGRPAFARRPLDRALLAREHERNRPGEVDRANPGRAQRPVTMSGAGVGLTTAAAGRKEANVLSQEQAARLMELNNQYRAQLGYDVSDRDNWFGAHLSNYLTLLCLSPRAAPSPRRVAQATKKKRVSFRAFASYFQRPAVAEDLLAELSRFVELPDDLAESIRQDFRELGGG